MNNVDKEMNFEVGTDLNNNGNSKTYNVKIKLGKETAPYVREAIIVLVSSIVRNNHKNIYGHFLSNEEIQDLIKSQAESWVDKKLIIKSINIDLKPLQTR